MLQVKSVRSGLLPIHRSGRSLRKDWRKIKIGTRGVKVTTNRLGEIRKNTFGTEMQIVGYRNVDDIDVKFLDEYGLKKSFDDIKEFYSRNAVELGFKHLPSRNPNLFVTLYTSGGKKINFAYISLE